ncbi:MAG: hypothetical protein NZ531_03945 [Aquificaceae bacterium]|nr:hypothetical protein [Aquificaceae bacterium]
MMSKVLVSFTLAFFIAFAGAQTQPTSESTTTKPPLKPIIFVPAGATLLTELQLTKEDLLPVVAQVFAYFSLHHSGGQVISGEQLRDLITSMEALWLVEYDFRQKGATTADLVQMNQSLLEAQGWRRVFWNRSSSGNRETMLMIEPPKKGLFVLTARRNESSGNIRVVAIRTQGEVDIGTTLWLLTTFLMKPEPPAPSSPSSSEKMPQVKPSPEKPQQEKQTDQEKPSGEDDSKGKKGD